MSKRRKRLVVEEWIDDQTEGLSQLKAMGVVSDDSSAMDLVRWYQRNMEYDYDDSCSATHEVLIADRWVESGRQVYTFDRDFSDSILNERWADVLPDVIGNRPFDSFYLKVPHNPLSEGAVVCVGPASEVANLPKDIVMKAIANGKGVTFNGQKPPLVYDGENLLIVDFFAIPNDYGLMFDDTDLGVYPPQLLVNALAYLCSANADVEGSYSPSPSLSAATVKKKRLSTATWHDVGYHIGAEIRKHAQYASESHGGSGRKVRPHMRRAHFHHFWRGPKDGPRELFIKWIPPIVVNADSGNEVEATAHKVR